MTILINVLSVIGALLFLCVIVTIHEMGHFGMGRLLNFDIDEFSIGLGPKVLSRKGKKDTLFSLRALPLGGMCRFYGEDEAAEEHSGRISITAQKAWKRFLVILAGPAMNILFTFIFAALFLFSYGKYEYQVSTTVKSLSEDHSSAADAGMLPGDELYAVDGVLIQDYEGAIAAIRGASNDPIVTVRRDGELLDLQLYNIYNPDVGYNTLGINLDNTAIRTRYGFFEAAGQSVPFVFSLIRQFGEGIAGMFTKGIQQGDFMGPVGIIATVSGAVRTNFQTVLYLAVILSISLSIMNLLPLPALDGGRLVFILIEWIRGKAIPPEKEGMVHLIGFALFMALFVLITFNDIRMLIGNPVK